MKASIRHIKAIFLKELQDYRRNPYSLIEVNFTFIFFILIMAISIIKHGNFNGMVYTTITAALTINTSFAAILFPATYILEEKEKKTLDVLILSGVSPLEFLIGKNLSTVFVTVLESAIMLILLKVPFKYIPQICLLVFIIIVSEVMIMSIIGIISKNQIQCAMYSLIFMPLFMLLPALSSEANLFYNINSLINISNMNFMIKNILTGKGFFYSQYSLFVIAIWFIVPLMLFVIVYKKKKLY